MAFTSDQFSWKQWRKATILALRRKKLLTNALDGLYLLCADCMSPQHDKYNPSMALVNGFCLLSINIITFRNCFQLNWSDVKTTPRAQSSSFPSLSSSHGQWRCNAPQTLRARCVVSGGVLVVGYGESLA